MDYKGNPSDAGTAIDEKVRGEYGSLLFSVRRSIRYHSRRSAFFGSVSRWGKTLSLFSGMGVVASVLKSGGTMTLVTAVLVGLFSAMDLAFGFSDKERLHDELKRRWIALEREIVLGESSLSEQWMKLKISERLEIETDEPPVVDTLNMLCHDEQVTAQGYGRLSNLTAFRKFFCQVDLPFLNPKLGRDISEKAA
jgi:hypothetical protein